MIATGLLSFLALCLSSSLSANSDPIEVFRSGESGYHTFRIPAIVRTASGDLLAFCEGRVEGSGDAGNIDVVMKRSSDDGATWGELRVVAENGVGTLGNPTPVVVRENGAILLFCVRQPTGTSESEIRRRGAGSRDPYLTRSDDGGETWSTLRNMPECDRADWGWYATGPCHAIQIEHGPYAGRLIVPANHSDSDGNYSAHLLLSDDLGETWRIGAVDEHNAADPYLNPNESSVAEIGDEGALYMNSRDQGGASPETRAAARSVDGGESFTRPLSRRARARRARLPRLRCCRLESGVLALLAGPVRLFPESPASCCVVSSRLEDGTWRDGPIVARGECRVLGHGLARGRTRVGLPVRGRGLSANSLSPFGRAESRRPRRAPTSS